jgi:hypothetical protein
MRAGVQKRLSWLELVLAADADAPPLAVDLSVFSDAELDRLEWFATRLATWSGDDWSETGLTPDERRELDALLAKIGPAPE